MNIAFVHYHTKKGGVTTVIGQQINVLRDHHHCLMIKGESGGVDFGIPTHIVPGLGYDEKSASDIDPEETGRKILEIIGPENDVLHIHNPLLKKNKKLIEILHYLKNHRVKLFLQIHDFAEDGRPGVYFKDDAYPTDVHYGVINNRDLRLLRQAGLRDGGLHFLPNMVTHLPYGDVDDEQNLILYPVRGIRRKNLGEILLLSLFLPPRLKMAITLPPNSQKDVEVFSNWKNLSGKLRLPVLFDVGEAADFSGVLGRSRFIITTSIKEGFGFSFLEPWTIGKEVRGRYLESVCPDFEEKGIVFKRLYRELLIPLESFDLERFVLRWEQGFVRWAGLFDVAVSEDEVRTHIDCRLVDHTIDFGQLDEVAQAQVIESLESNDVLKNKMMEINPWLVGFFRQSDQGAVADTRVIEQNREIILNEYGPESYRRKLLTIYKKLKRHVPQRVEKKKILDSFLRIENYLPLGS